MTSHLGGLTPLLWILWSFIAVVQGDFVEPSPSCSLESLAEAETQLPCQFKVEVGQVVVQVTWTKEKADGTKDQIITVHHTDGHTEFGQYSGRVRFSSKKPTVDSSLIIMNTVESDEGRYNCHISTFPSGNFERQLSLTVWTTPISSLDPVILVEGQSFRLAASCRSVARPPPHLSWDTDLTGQSHNRSLEGGSVSTHFSLHPLRSMDGKRLDCLVRHPALKGPRRITNNLVVHYPPNAEISGFDQNWYAGLEEAALSCVSGGNPKPQSFSWTRKGGDLPEGVTTGNGSLLFNRPLVLTDAGIYQCVAMNSVGADNAEVEITVTELPQEQASFDSLLMIIVGGVAGVLLLVMIIIVISVTRHHKRKNKKLSRELTVRKEEISTLSRQASFRKMNSVSMDTRGQTEENIPLRVEGTLRTSLSSVGEQGRIRESRSTLVGGGGLDYLGRPVLYNSSRRGRESRAMDREEENRLRVESNVQNSTMSLANHLHPPLQPSPFPMEQSIELLRSLNGSAIIPTEWGLHIRQGPGSRNTHSPLSCNNPPITDDEDEEDEGVEGEWETCPRMSPLDQGRSEDQDSKTNSSQISEVECGLNPHFQQNNGTLRPKPLPKYRPNGILLTSSPHASFIHKAQIV
ncbi:nectin-4 [Salmo salar]|uniref:Nectin-4 n=1 Tax=Salmo salar TaxID=8030 RepID=A0A1S3N7K0_SALSA|nr:nectin-4 [Salmo salar]|eukprot:XP_014011453.1 PREDICTED: nectin-4-like [Salmo salar]